MRKITITEYVTTATTKTPFLNNNDVDISLIPEFIVNETFQSSLTNTIQLIFGDLYLRKVEPENLRELLIQNKCNSVYKLYAYKYKTLYETTIQKYNPIENYSLVESGEDTTHFGENKIVNTLGERTNTNVSGKREQTENEGIRITANVNGEMTKETLIEVSPYETENFSNENKNTETTNAFTNETTQQPVQNKITAESFTDTFTEGGKEDTEIRAAKTDTLEHSLKRSGNIGVTTTQQMLESERNIANFSLLEIIASDIIKFIAIQYYGSIFD